MSVFEQNTKINVWLAFTVALVSASAFFQPAVAGSDLWWHLASGREIWNAGGVMTTDPFSWTYAGREWMNHEWLWDLLYWGAYSIDPEAVAWLNLGVIFAVYGLAWWNALEFSESLIGAAAAVWMAAAAAHWYLDIRPHLTTLWLLGVFLATRHKPWAVFLWPALMAFWCNTHAGFVFGFGAIGLHVLVYTVRLSLEARRPVIPRREWASVGATALAFLANPWGWRILEYPRAYLDSRSPFRGLIEWRPPDLALDFASFSGRFWWIVLAAALGTAYVLWRRWDERPLEGRARFERTPRLDPYILFLAAVCFWMAVTSRRFIPLFGIAAAPLVAAGIAGLVAFLRERLLPAGTREPLGYGLAFIAVVIGFGMWGQIRLVPNFLTRWTEGDLYPDAALQYLAAIDPGERLLNYYNWGGYIMLHQPQFKTFIDGRANTLYEDKIYLDYVAMLTTRRGLAGRVAQYGGDAALLPAGGALARAMASPPIRWRPVYIDDVAVILLPPDSPVFEKTQPDIAAVLGNHSQQLFRLGANALREGDLPAARGYYERSIAADPLRVRTYGELAQVMIRSGESAAVPEMLERAIAALPRRRGQFRMVEYQAHRARGDLPAAAAALRDALPYGPFAQAPGLARELAELEKQIASQRR